MNPFDVATVSIAVATVTGHVNHRGDQSADTVGVRAGRLREAWNMTAGVLAPGEPR
jgi:hypothetical protein